MACNGMRKGESHWVKKIEQRALSSAQLSYGWHATGKRRQLEAGCGRASRIGPHGMVPIGPRPSHPAKKHVSQVKSEEQPDWVSVAALLALSPHEALPSRLVPATAGCIGDFCGPPT